MIQKISALLLVLIVSAAWARFDIVGVVLEEGSDRPIPYAILLYASGKEITRTDSRGRFQARIPTRNAKFLLRRTGYRDREIDLQEYTDLIDLVFVMEGDARDLGQATVTGQQAPVRRFGGRVPLRSLEDAAGLRLDLAEHLAQMPGVSGQKDFSSELSYLGSRPDELAYAIGALPVPNMRHLDVGFPGNLSVINPRMLQGLQIHDHLGTGPLQQGLAGAVQLDPAPVDGRDFALGASMGTTSREFRLSSPWFFGDGIALSFRYLDPDMLRNMGEKFFTEFRRPDVACEGCKIESRESQFQLSSWDIMTHISATDSAGGASGLTLLYSADRYKVSQDTGGRLDRINSSDILRGHQTYMVAGYQSISAQGTGFHIGMVRESRGDTLRDTAGFLPNRVIAADEAFRNFIDRGERLSTDYIVGADAPLALQALGARWLWAAEYQRREHQRSFPRDGSEQEETADGNQLQGAVRSRWTPTWGRAQLAMGAVSDLSEHHGPIGSIDLERDVPQLEGLRLLAGTAWRQQLRVVGSGHLERRLESGLAGRLGAGYEQGRIRVLAQGYGRYYPDPVLPEPKALWHYAEQAQTEHAWVGGAALNLEWRTLHHVALAQNWATTYGEYALQGGSSLPWAANTRLEASSHLRWYPRSDSLFSVIVSHRASWHRPLYAWEITHWSRGSEGEYVDGERRIRQHTEYLDLYRTDVRMNLDLSSRWPPLRDVRFYVEADNIFATLDVPGFQWLGGPNVRERSVVATQTRDSGYILSPFIADGMGFYLQFGVEGSLGF